MRKYILAALVLLAAGVGISIYLIPTEREVVGGTPALQQPVDVTKIDVEAEYNAGKRSFPIVSGLADKRVAAGDAKAAVAYIEGYVTANPKDVSGLKKLAELYLLVNNRTGYNQQLEFIAAAEPNEANLRALSDIYNAEKEYAKQAEILKKIVEVTKGSNPQAFVDLATVYVSLGDSENALKTVQELKTKHPTYSNYSMTRIMVNVLAETGKADEAFAAAKQWMDTPEAPVPSPTPQATQPAVPAAPVAAVATANSKTKNLADLCDILHYSGYADKAVALVDLYPDLLQKDPELVLSYVNANITAGRSDHAYNILKTIDDANAMIAALYPPYIDLTLKREDVAGAEAIANKLNVTTFNEEQALRTLDVARVNDASSVLTILARRFGEPTVVADKPVLNAVIAILTKDASQDQKIEAALNAKLTGTQRISLGEACARASKTACFEAVLKLYPALEQMTAAQVGEYTQLYIIADRAGELVDPVGKLTQVEHPQAQVQTSHRRLAAAAGRFDILKPWLEANANKAPLMHLRDLFYLANDHKHYEVSTDIAERLYARDPSPMNRDIMVAAYIASEKFDKALPLLRDQMAKTPGADDRVYLMALSKVARKDAAARKELVDYTTAALQSGRGDNRAQLNYAYILVNNGRKDTAITYAKKFSAERGGEWKRMLSQLTQKGGSTTAKLSREQMIALAKSPSASSATKRQMAYNLLNAGHKADATAIFQALASDKGPESKEMQELLYMWGGKLNNEQLAWIQARAAKATPYDKDCWATLINGVADDNSVLAYVGVTPDALYNRDLRRRYFRILAGTGNRNNYDVAMRGWVAGTSDVPALLDYATIAQDTGFNEAAANGFSRVLQIDPNNTLALSRMAMIDFSKGKFTAADQKLNQYLASNAAKPNAETDPSQAHFYKAQLLRRAGKKDEARAEFQQVVNLTAQSGASTPDALSRMYTAQFHLGQHADAKAGFEQLLEQSHGDKNILADYMGVLIEYNYLDDATRIANQYDKNSPYYRGSSMLIGRSSNTARVEQLSNGREMKISFAEPIEDQAPIDVAAAKKQPWLERAHVGYDSVSLTAKPGYVIRYQPTAQDQFAVVAAPAPNYAPQVEAQRMQDLRLQLLYARIEQQTGQVDRARERLAALNYYYPNNPQLLVYQSSVESMSGDSDRAMELLAQAQAAAPENEDFSLQMQNMRSVGRGTDYAKLDHEYRHLGDNSEHITTFTGVVHADRNEFGIAVQNDILKTENTQRASDGSIGDFDVTRQRGELYVARNFGDGSRAQGSLYANNKDLGAGLSYAFNNAIGRTELMGEYQRPYWDFVQAVYEHTTRDRIGFKHFATLQPGTSLSLEGSLNNYNIEEENDVASTGLVRANLVQQIQPKTESQPYLAVGYGFDGEYRLDTPETGLDAFGQPYYLLPVRTREVHALTGIYSDDWTPDLHALFIGGFAYDRINGGFSPLAEAHLDHDVTEQLQVGGRARYALETNNTDNKALNLGADVIYKF